MSNKHLQVIQNTKPVKRFAGFCLLLLSLGFLSMDAPYEIRFPGVLFVKNSIEFYDSDSLQLKYDGTGMESVEHMYKTLAANPTIIVEVSAHASAEEKNAQALSQRRAVKVWQLLIQMGIDSARVVPKGYGATRMKISEIAIAKAKTAAEKERLRQINRRAVYKILSWEYPATKEDSLKAKNIHFDRR